MNRTVSRLGIVIAVGAGVAASLPACSQSDSTSPTSSSTKPTVNATPTSTGPVTSTPTSPDCTTSGLADAATKAVQAVAPDNTYRIDSVRCAAGWAVTSGLWSSKANPGMGAPTTLVFQQQGTQWVNQDKQKVCGTNASTTPAPADAKIPAELYELGCLTG